MTDHILLPVGQTDALQYAVAELKRRGCQVCTTPNGKITHMLLPVPSFTPDGTVPGCGALEDVLSKLPKDIIIMGGNLQRPQLKEYTTIDLLQDPLYLAENAAITAHCAIRIAMDILPCTLQNCPVLVVGWGRIGKALADLLKKLGANVSVAVRKESDRAMLLALGYDSEILTPPAYGLARYRLIFNTVPAMVLPEAWLEYCQPDCLKIDLASVPGIGGADVVWARGLPNKYAPETSGALIARTVLRLAAGKER